jgi:hypothetical protein
MKSLQVRISTNVLHSNKDYADAIETVRDETLPFTRFTHA